MISIFLLDNVDSFSYNLVDELRTLKLDVRIYRNTVDANYIFEQMQQQSQSSQVVLVLSPGPGSPSDAGCMPELLKFVDGKFPVIGICLGHQAIVEHFGGEVIRAGEVLHGKSSDITHCNNRMFAGFPQPLPVARYHSLVGDNLPENIEVTAKYQDLAMAIYQAESRMIGYQFHPESILTAQGSELLLQSVRFLLDPTQSGTSHTNEKEVS